MGLRIPPKTLKSFLAETQGPAPSPPPSSNGPLMGEILPPAPPASALPGDKIALARSKGLTAVGWANSLQVVSDADFEIAAGYLSGVVKLGLSWWDQIRDPGIARAKKLLDDSRAEKKADVQPFLDAEVIIKKKMSAWVVAKRERALLEANRERLRRQEEAERQAEEEARLLVDQGDEEAAAEIYEDLAEGRIESSISVPPPVAEKPKAGNTSVKMIWKWAMVDRTKVNPTFLIPDEKAIGRLVRSMKSQARAEEIVGKGSIRTWEEADIASKAASDEDYLS